VPFFIIAVFEVHCFGMSWRALDAVE